MKQVNSSLVSRRTVLRGAVGGALVTAGVAAEPANAQPSFDGWMENVDNYDGIVDATGQSEVTVTVGAEGNNGNFAFDPAALQVDPGTTIVWEWNGKGGQHNVNAMEGDDFESDLVQEAGHLFEYSVEDTGIIKYQCDPHAGLGMKGVLVVGDAAIDEDAGGAANGDTTGKADGEIDYGGWFTEDARGGAVSNFTGTVDRRGESEVTVTVGTEGNGGNFAFGPAAVWVDPGTTVRFEWNGKGGEHNVVNEAGPAALDSGDPVTEPGVHYEYTFEDPGVNTYYCAPHLSLGMKGAVAVGDDVPMKAIGGEGGEGAEGRPLPGGDIGGAMMGALLGIPGLVVLSIIIAEFYGSLKQAGRPAGPGEEIAEEAPTPESERGIVREIGHDEFDPTGTASLIVLYFLILLVMWVFVYFIEFLGRGVTIIG